MELADRLLIYLGKSDTDAEFLQFLTEFKSFLVVTDSQNSITIYDFPKLGFSFGYCSEIDSLMYASFAIFTRGVEDGNVTPFSGLLPFGISISDSRLQIRDKLGVDPVRSTPEDAPHKPSHPSERYDTWHDTYNRPPFDIGISFHSARAGLISVFISYTPLYAKWSAAQRQRRQK